MITCNKCSKENQDHYKFCLGCGAELPRGAAAPKAFAANTPPQGMPAAKPGAAGAAPKPAAPKPAAPKPAAAAPKPSAAAPRLAAAGAVPRPGAAKAGAAAASQPPAAAAEPEPVKQPSVRPAAAAAPAAPAGAEVPCPQCGHPNVQGNRFCASCGYNLLALQGAASQAPAAPAAAAVALNVVLTALRADGSEAGSFPLPDGPTVTVGRDTGSIFAGDSYLSPRHATFGRHNGQLAIRDEGSLNGVYLKLQPNAPWPMRFGDVFRIGQEIIRFEELQGQGPAADGVERLGSPARGYIGRLALVIGRDTTGNAFPVPEVGIHLGRERGDVLFSEDGYVSGLHCRFAREQDGNVYLTDVGSSNGTFVRLSADHVLQPGDVLLMGQQLFRVDM